MTIRSAVKILAYNILPEPIFYRLWHFSRRRNPRTERDTVFDHRVTTPQEGVHLEVCWSDVPNVGRGPSASLFVLREEVVRFDCFGGNAGHMHINPEQIQINLRSLVPRLYFPSGRHEDHIERAAFELATNTTAALKLNKIARIREFPIDTRKLAVAAGQMADDMYNLLVSHGERSVEPIPQTLREF